MSELGTTAAAKAHCNQCQSATNHDILHSEETSWQEEFEGGKYSIGGLDRYETLKCRGCESIRLRHTSYFSEDDEPTITYFPPAVSRREPEWLKDIPDSESGEVVHDLLKEIYSALQNGSVRLAAIGSRSLLEHMMVEKVGDQGSFGKNVSTFKSAGHISEQHAGYLLTAIEAGHASTHRAWRPTTSQMNLLLDIIESVVAAVYVLNERTAALKENIPPKGK